jgi:PLP dependent protein
LNKDELFARQLASITDQLGPAHLLIACKGRSLEDIETYYRLGHRDFGENKVQELETKAQALRERCPELRWHMIGHLQSNKINHLFRVPGLVAIHSVHDRHLLDKLLASQDKLEHALNLFLQVNTSHELEKSGFETYTELEMAAQILRGNSKLKLAGLMTMGTIRTQNFEAEARRCFEELRAFKEKLETDLGSPLQLSMGMSQDYYWALQEKTDWIRLGTVMFEGFADIH